MFGFRSKLGPMPAPFSDKTKASLKLARLRSPDTHHTQRRVCLRRGSSRRRRGLVGLKALFREYAMQGPLPPHPKLLAFTNIN